MYEIVRLSNVRLSFAAIEAPQTKPRPAKFSITLPISKFDTDRWLRRTEEMYMRNRLGKRAFRRWRGRRGSRVPSFSIIKEIVR